MSLGKGCASAVAVIAVSLLVCGCTPPQDTSPVTEHVRGNRSVAQGPVEDDEATPLFPVSEGYIDKTGKLVLKRHSRPHRAFSEGLAPVKGFWGKWGYIDKRNKVVIPCRFSECKPFSEGLAAVNAGSSDARDWSYIDTKGDVVISGLGSAMASPFAEGFAYVVLCRDEKRDTHGFIDKTGNMAIVLPGEPHWTNYDDPPRFSGGVAAVRLGDDGWGYIDRAGEVVMRGFESAEHFSEGLGAAQLNGKWGYIDRAGQWALEPQFDHATSFSEGLAWVVRHPQEGDPTNMAGTWYCIDRKGAAVFTPRSRVRYVTKFAEGLALVRVGGEIGYIDRKGNMAIQPRFEQASDFSNGLALVARIVRGPRLSSGHHYECAYIDKTGEFIRGFEGDHSGIVRSISIIPP